MLIIPQTSKAERGPIFALQVTLANMYLPLETQQLLYPILMKISAKHLATCNKIIQGVSFFPHSGTQNAFPR